MNAIREFLEAQPVIVVLLVLALGAGIGRIRILGFQLGSVTGVLFIALVFGHFGFTGDQLLQTLGFALFMYVVGFEAGPRVFTVLRQDGLKYVLLSLLIAAAGFITALFLGKVISLPPGAVAGALAGGMTTTPTLAAAQDAVQGGQATIPEGLSADEIVANITAGYAITYLVGLVGLILIIKLLPRALSMDLAAAASEISEESGKSPGAAKPNVGMRAFRLSEDSIFVGKTLREGEKLVPDDATLVRLRRNGEFLDPQDRNRVIESDDCVTIVGLLPRLQAMGDDIGVELADPEMLDVQAESALIVLLRKDAANKSINELGIATDYGCLPTRVRRSGIDLEPGPDLKLRYGDVLSVTAPEPFLVRLGHRLGHLERDIAETDLFVLLLGAALGVAIGAISITVGGVPLSLGLSGGVLLTGILFGFLRSVRPAFGRVPSGARWFIMEMGLLLFMAGVGLAAGESIIQTLREAGAPLLLVGTAITVVPVIVGVLAGRLLFRMNLALLFGGITGAMTSTAAMRIVCDEAKSTAPALGYTGAYALANIILALAGFLIIRFELMGFA